MFRWSFAFMLLVCTLPLLGQVKKGFKYLEKKDYAKARIAFEADLANPDKKIPAGFGLMKVCAASKDFDELLRGIQQGQETHDAFMELSKEDQKKMNDKFKVSKSGIETLSSTLTTASIAMIEKNKVGKSEYDALVEVMGGTIPTKFKPRMGRLETRYYAPAPSAEAVKSTFDATKYKPTSITIVDRMMPEGSKAVFVKGVNTEGVETFPILSADGKTMYILGKGRTDSYSKEDIFVATRREDGSWGPSKLDYDLSGDDNECVIGASADGNQLVLFIEGKTYTSQRNAEGGWQAPEPLTFKKAFTWVGSLSVSSNGEAVIFDASEDAQTNLKELYVAIKQTDGSWGEPIKLNDVVNNGQTNRSPFLHYDTKTLYFSSARAGGQGALDVFKTTRLDNSWKQWSLPVNLGADVNSAGDDMGFFIPPSGDVAYYSTQIPGFNDPDIVQIPLGNEARPEAQVVITGKLTDGTGAGVSGDIIVEDATTNAYMQKVRSLPDGNFTFTVAKTAKINFYASGVNVISPTKSYVDASTYRSDVTVEKISIVTTEELTSKGMALALRNILFDFGQAKITATSATELDRLYQSLKDRGWDIEIGGHTDDVGSLEDNRALSAQRAEAVRTYLVSLGYPEGKITARGYGSTSPVAANDTEANRALNRRVELKIVQ